MRLSFLIPLIALASVTGAEGYQVQIVGKPEVKRVMVPSVVYFGGDVELRVNVQVLDDNGKPLPDMTVTLSAMTKDGGLARLRAFGITDNNGMALVRTMFDIPVSNLKASLVACLVEPQDECGKTVEVDLTRRNDLETSFGYSKSAIGGTIPYSIVGKANSATTQDTLAAETDYEIRANFIHTLLSTGSLAHSTQLFASVEGGYSASHLDIPLNPKNNSTSLRPGDVDFTLDAIIWGRLQASASYAPVISSVTGYRAFSGTWEQPVSERIRIAGGYSYYAPRTNSPGASDGIMRGPMASFVFAPKRGGNGFTATVGYVATGRTVVRDTNQNLRLYAATTSPSASFAWDFHRGGYAYMTFYMEADQIAIGAPVYGFGTRVTFRDWVPRLR